MRTPKSTRRGRPRTSELSRLEQLRHAKRAQRARERAAGMEIVPVKLPAADAARLRAALALPGFGRELVRLLDDTLIDTTAYANLAALCWNRRDRYLNAEEAFRLYERNWRLVDARHMEPVEKALVDRLIARYGNGVLNV